jgi:hypothetical protein
MDIELLKLEICHHVLNLYYFSQIILAGSPIYLPYDRFYIYPFYATTFSNDGGPFRIYFKLKGLNDLKSCNKIKILTVQNPLFSGTPICSIKQYKNPTSNYKTFFDYINSLDCVIISSQEVNIIFRETQKLNPAFLYELIITSNLSQSNWLSDLITDKIAAFSQSNKDDQYLEISLIYGESSLLQKSSRKFSYFKNFPKLFQISSLYFTNPRFKFALYLRLDLLADFEVNQFIEFSMPITNFNGDFSKFPCFLKLDLDVIENVMPECVKYNDPINKNLVIRLQNRFSKTIKIGKSIYLSLENINIATSLPLYYYFYITLNGSSMKVNELFNISNNSPFGQIHSKTTMIEYVDQFSHPENSFYYLFWKRTNSNSKIIVLRSVVPNLGDIVSNQIETIFVLEFPEKSFINYQSNFEKFELFCSNENIRILFKNKKTRRICKEIKKKTKKNLLNLK